MEQPLAGRTIALPETRESKLLAQMIEEKGGTAVCCPMVGILDAPDAKPVNDWLAKLIAGDFDDVILLTGEGLRRLIGFASQAGIVADVVRALGKVRKITRGPKPARALREIDLAPDIAAGEPTTDGVIASLSNLNMKGRAVGLQLYGQVPNPKLVGYLESVGASVFTVAPYVYAPASDEQQVARLIRRLNSGEIDVVAFTSASQVERLWDVSKAHGLDSILTTGLGRTLVAAVGPVVADELCKRGVSVRISPESSFFMRPMVNEIIKALASNPSGETRNAETNG